MSYRKCDKISYMTKNLHHERTPSKMQICYTKCYHFLCLLRNILHIVRHLPARRNMRML